MKGKRKKRPARERPYILKIIDILHEDAKRRRAIRVLEKQSWGLEFLSAALVRAGKSLGEGISLVIVNRDGVRMELSYDSARSSLEASGLDDSIFMKLDDDLAVERFIRANSRR